MAKRKAVKSEVEMSNVAQHISQQFFTRVENMRLTKANRDSMAVEFALGAATALQVTGNIPAMNSALLLAEAVKSKGFAFMEAYANKETKPTFTEE